jgi:hypothetical protein
MNKKQKVIITSLLGCVMVASIGVVLMRQKAKEEKSIEFMGLKYYLNKNMSELATELGTKYESFQVQKKIGNNTLTIFESNNVSNLVEYSLDESCDPKQDITPQIERFKSLAKMTDLDPNLEVKKDTRFITYKEFDGDHDFTISCNGGDKSYYFIRINK